MLRNLTRLSLRCLHTTPSRHINITFIDGDKQTLAKAIRGDTLLESAKDYNVKLAATCGGMAECSTCHVIADDATMSMLDEAGEEEMDTLDAAPGVTDNSRLACQVDVTRKMEGAVFYLPKETKDVR